MNNIRNYFLILFFSFLSAQNIDMYLSLLEKGNTKGVRENIPELISKYPSDPGVLFLKAF